MTVGACVSVVTGTGSLTGDSFPVGSVCVAVTLWSPSSSPGASGVILKVPLLSHVAVGAISVPST